MSRRTQRIGHLLQREIAKTLLVDVSDPRINFVSITTVNVSTDLRNATVLYSVIGDDEDKKQARRGLMKAAKYIQKIITQKLKLKHSPKIIFKYDTMLEEAAHIEAIIDSLERPKSEENLPESDETNEGTDVNDES